MVGCERELETVVEDIDKNIAFAACLACPRAVGIAEDHDNFFDMLGGVGDAEICAHVTDSESVEV